MHSERLPRYCPCCCCWKTTGCGFSFFPSEPFRERNQFRGQPLASFPLPSDLPCFSRRLNSGTDRGGNEFFAYKPQTRDPHGTHSASAARAWGLQLGSSVRAPCAGPCTETGRGLLPKALATQSNHPTENTPKSEHKCEAGSGSRPRAPGPARLIPERNSAKKEKQKTKKSKNKTNVHEQRDLAEACTCPCAVGCGRGHPSAPFSFFVS